MSGASDRYRGAEGRDYFAWQDEIGRTVARLDRWKFADHVSERDVVLDFGCGGGWLLAALPAARRIGVDVNPAAREQAAANGLEVHERTADVRDPVDVVIVHHALEHTEEPLAELRALFGVLRPGGRIVHWSSLHDARVDKLGANNTNFHLYTWTPLLIANLLVAAGFVVDDARVVSHAWSLRFAALYGRVPDAAFDALCRVTSAVRRRREVTAVAHRPG